MGKKSRKKRSGVFGGGLSRKEEEVMLMTLVHFPHAKEEGDYRCEECEDFRSGVCTGRGFSAEDVMGCMADKVFSGSEGAVSHYVQ